jgi:phosphate transport system substrate-binding protein
MRLRSLVALLIAFTTLGLPAAPASADTVTLSETGSTLFYPLFRLWVGQYEKVTPTVRIGLGATGSEAGVAQAMSGAVQLGASDAFMTDEQLGNNPQVMNIPLAIAAETINYNIPGLNGTPLKIDGPSVAAPRYRTDPSQRWLGLDVPLHAVSVVLNAGLVRQGTRLRHDHSMAGG